MRLLNQFAENIGVASPNYVYRLFQEAPAEEPELSSESNKGASEQYVVNKLQLDEVHKVATGEKVLVAVIDSAIDKRNLKLRADG